MMQHLIKLKELAPPPGSVKEIYVGRGDVVRLPIDEKVFMPSPAGIFFLETLYDTYFRLADRKTRILDLGCGSGILSIALGLHGFWNITGADVNSKYVSYARKQYSAHIPNNDKAVFHEANLFEGIPDGDFDVIAFNCPGWATPTVEYASTLRHVSGSHYGAMFEGDKIAARCVLEAIPRLAKGGSLFLGLNSIGDIKTVISTAQRGFGGMIDIVHVAKTEFPLLFYTEAWRSNAKVLVAQFNRWREMGMSYFRWDQEKIFSTYDVVWFRKRMNQ